MRILFFIAALSLFSFAVSQEPEAGINQALYGGNCQGDHYSPLKQASDRNVAHLGLDW